MNPDSPIRWGILGSGSMAAEFARGLRLVADASIQAVGSRSLASAQAFAGRHAVARAFGSYEALVADPEIDVVYIATVNTSHRDLCLLALEAGKPVICEKPFALNAVEARAVIARARERGLFCMEAMWTRFLPAMTRLKELLDRGEIGAPRLFSARIGYPFAIKPAARHFDPALGGGALLDLGIYPISLAFFLFGPAQSAIGRASLAETGVDATEAMILTHPEGRISALTASVTTASPNDAVVMGTRGEIRLHSPLVRPERLSIRKSEPIDPSVSGGGSGRLAKLKENPMVRAAYRGLSAIKGAGESRLSLPCTGNGYAHEAEEVMRCLRQGLRESPVMPLDESVAILELMDRLRADWGVRFPGESTVETA